MKRPQCAIIVKDQNGKKEQIAIYKTVKEAEEKARELAIKRLKETGIQTKFHTKKFYIFYDDYEISIEKIYN